MTLTLAVAPWSTMLARVAEADVPDDLEREKRAVVLAQGGDRSALGILLVKYGPVLYRSVLLPRLGSEAAAKDALGETYAKVVERIGQFTWQGGGLYPWLRTVALRVAISALMIEAKARPRRSTATAPDTMASEATAAAPAPLPALRWLRSFGEPREVAALAFRSECCSAAGTLPHVPG